MTVMVTGAAGHVGGNLVRSLLAQGRPVRVLIHRDRRAVAGLEVEVCEGDVRDPSSLQRAFAGAEVVYHAAAHISLRRGEWPLLEATNVVGTRNVVEACLACGVRRLVHFSSIHALTQEPLEVPIDEDRPLVGSRGCLPYDRSKAESEREVHKALEKGLDAIILIPTAIIGPHDFRPSYFGQVLLALAQGRMPALVEGGFDWVDVRDVVAASLTAEEGAPAGARYLLSGQWAPLREVASLVEEVTGRRSPRLAAPIWLARMSAPVAVGLCRKGRRPLFTPASVTALCGNKRICHERAGRDLDYHPRPLRETIRDTLQWFSATGRLAASGGAAHRDLGAS